VFTDANTGPVGAEVASPSLGDAEELPIGCNSPSFAEIAPSFIEGAPSFPGVIVDSWDTNGTSEGEISLGSTEPSNHVLAMSKFSSVAISVELRTNPAQFGGIVPSRMNETVLKVSSNTT
jgi:hypothetical protein